MPPILLTPGPTAVPTPVLEAMAEPIIHHRTAAFREVIAALSGQLRQVFGTSGAVLSMAGSGTTAFESAQLSLATPGSTVIAVAGGKFGERWQDIYDAYAAFLNLRVVKIDHAWGEPAPVDRIEAALQEHGESVSAVAVVHSETSTATASDVQAIAALTRAHPSALLLVDGITSVGAFPCPMDDWGIDCLVTGSQKAMMLPPGLGYLALGPRALDRLQAIDAPPPCYAMDLRKWVKSAAKDDSPFTPPVSLLRAQRVACELMLGEGLGAVHQRTARLQAGAIAAFQAMGLKLVSTAPSPSVTGAYYPDGVTDDLRKAVRDQHDVHLAGGQDGRGAKWKGKIFRVSHMGHVDETMTRTGLEAIATCMANAGYHQADPAAALGAFDAAVSATAG
ncbi:MAG: alanine--glyoxylate aminotransferase family protein [Planctomycetota bacterium]